MRPPQDTRPDDQHARPPVPAMPESQTARFQEALQTALGQQTNGETGARLRKTRSSLPWYLLLGPPGSGKTTLLHSLAQQLPPVVCPEGAWHMATPDYAWWFFTNAGILDTSGHYALARPFTEAHNTWTHIIDGLHEARPTQPLHGVIVTVAADALAVATPDTRQAEALCLRQRLSDLEDTLGVRLPIYVLVTRCDLIEGFIPFFAHLPVHILNQVFGWLHAVPRARRALTQQSPAPLEVMGNMMSERLERLRSFILHETAGLNEGLARQQIFSFLEEWRALSPRLQAYLEVLCQVQTDQPPLWLRGLFYCSATQQGQPVSLLRQAWDFPAPAPIESTSTDPYFIRDLLTVILPRDRHLAHPLDREKRH